MQTTDVGLTVRQRVSPSAPPVAPDGTEVPAPTVPAHAPPVATAPASALVPVLAVVRSRVGHLPGPFLVTVALLVTALGVLVDLSGDPTLGAGTATAVLVVAVGAPALARLRSLMTALVLPPLLVAGSASALAVLGGRNRGSRDVVLDVGTTLALSAPLVFGATAVVILSAVVRLGVHAARRRAMT